MTYSTAGTAPSEERGSLRDLLPAVSLLALGLCGLGYGALYSDSVPGQFIVISAPGTPPLQSLRQVVQAGGALISAGSFDNIIHAASEEADFAARLREAGAWMVLPAPAFLGCGPDRLEK